MRKTLRRWFGKHSKYSAPSPSTPLAPLGNGSGNRPASIPGSLESASTHTSQAATHSTPSPDMYERPASAQGSSASRTATAATSQDLQQHASPSPPATVVEATSPEQSVAVISLDPQQSLPAPIQTPWEKAIEKLKPEDRKEFNIDDPNKHNAIVEALQAVNSKRQECEDKKWSYKKGNGEVVVLRDIAERLFTNLNKFVKIGDVTVRNSPQMVSVAWSAFGHLLQVGLSDIVIMGNLLSDLEFISRILSRCAIYEKLYGNDPASAQNLLNALPDLYVSILVYLSHSKRYFGKNTAARYINGMVHSYTAEFEPLLDEIRKVEKIVEAEARAAADEFQGTALARVEKMSTDQRKAILAFEDMLQSMRQGNEDRLQKIRERLEDTERFDILKWLSEVTYERDHDFVSSARQAETGHWLFEKHSFIEWKKSSSSSIFWLHGEAGTGKTTLASLVIDTFSKTKSTDHALAYFYCKDGDNERQDPESVLSTIVQQFSVMDTKGSLPDSVVSLYRSHKKNGFKSGRLRLGESKQLILQLSKAFKQTIIVIDALDECNKRTRSHLLEALTSLCSSTEGMKIFVTSRNNDDILFQLENELEVCIEPSDNANDIEMFVHAEVEKYISEKRLLRGSVAPELKQTIIDTLINDAHGTFSWVHLQIEHISREISETAIRKTLQRPPTDLEAIH